MVERFTITSEYVYPITDELAGYESVTGADNAIDPALTGSIFTLGLRSTAIDDQTTIYSSRNVDNPDMADHMVTFEIVRDTGHPQNTIGNYVIAWEDSDGFDNDFNDVVVEVSGLQPVPEPEAWTLALIGIGVLLAGALASRVRPARRPRAR